MINLCSKIENLSNSPSHRGNPQLDVRYKLTCFYNRLVHLPLKSGSHKSEIVYISQIEAFLKHKLYKWEIKKKPPTLAIVYHHLGSFLKSGPSVQWGFLISTK